MIVRDPSFSVVDALISSSVGNLSGDTVSEWYRVAVIGDEIP
jgi:hypothetical protein